MSDCDCNTGTFEFPTVKSGCSLVGFEITISEEDAQADLADVSIRFKLPGSDAWLLTLTVADGLEILQATSPWIVSVLDRTVVSLAAGLHIGEMVTTDVDGITEVFLEPTWPII